MKFTITMATIKSYTDVEQSRRLAKILPLESADMHYVMVDTENEIYSAGLSNYIGILPSLPCWSLAALLDILKEYCNGLDIALRADKRYNIFAVVGSNYVYRSFDTHPDGIVNLIEVFVDIIEKLHELKML